MKIYTRILGIFNVIILLSGITVLIIFTIQQKEWLLTFLFLIPIYFYSHYLIATRIGFINNQISKQVSTTIISLSVLTIIIIGIVPVSTWINYTINNNKLKLSSDWGQDTTMYNIHTNLKTRLIDNQIEYVFTAKFDQNSLLQTKMPEIKVSGSFHPELVKYINEKYYQGKSSGALKKVLSSDKNKFDQALSEYYQEFYSDMDESVFREKYFGKHGNPFQKIDMEKIEYFIIRFYDEDGFEVETLKIDSWINGFDTTSTHKIGVRAFGSKSFNIDSYQRISDYEASVFLKPLQIE